MEIVAAIILGIFFLTGIVLHHWLNLRLRSDSERSMRKAFFLTAPVHWVYFVTALISYTTFTALLLSSSGGDYDVGLLSLINVFVLCLGGGLAIARKVSIFRVYCVAGSAQVIILIAMLIWGMGSAGIVIPINLLIIVGFGLLAWRSVHRHRQKA
ncbi:MAG: hypothetical protein Q8M92_06305 [Candidatus Subteraquimicrobiales bacterium]|nr:hypothetical protein [Candidatus Subteraquimicrobiales bacterium]